MSGPLFVWSTPHSLSTAIALLRSCSKPTAKDCVASEAVVNGAEEDAKLSVGCELQRSRTNSLVLLGTAYVSCAIACDGSLGATVPPPMLAMSSTPSDSRGEKR